MEYLIHRVEGQNLPYVNVGRFCPKLMENFIGISEAKTKNRLLFEWRLSCTLIYPSSGLFSRSVD